jgi:hypothetical protein
LLVFYEGKGHKNGFCIQFMSNVRIFNSVTWDFSAPAAATEVRIEADTVEENHRRPAKSDGVPLGFCHWLSLESSVCRDSIAHRCPAVDAAIGQCRPLPIDCYLPGYYCAVDRFVIQNTAMRRYRGGNVGQISGLTLTLQLHCIFSECAETVLKAR